MFEAKINLVIVRKQYSRNCDFFRNRIILYEKLYQKYANEAASFYTRNDLTRSS